MKKNVIILLRNFGVISISTDLHYNSSCLLLSDQPQEGALFSSLRYFHVRFFAEWPGFQDTLRIPEHCYVHVTDQRSTLWWYASVIHVT
jgi:hypothetical protein